MTAEPLPARPPRPPWVEFAHAPLVPVALAATAGLVLDRYAGGSVAAGLAVAVVALVAYARVRTHPPLWLAALGLALAYHHAHRHEFPADDIGRLADDAPRVVTLRGTVADDPITRTHATADPLVPRHLKDYDLTTFDATALATAEGWVPASGRVRLRVDRDADSSLPLHGLKPGDAAEVVGQLTRPQAPGNPGERDPYDRLLDRRLRGDLRGVGPNAVTRWEAGDWSFDRVLAALRSYGIRTIHSALPPDRTAVARALLLGDGSAMDRAEWDAYVRTGVVHVLAISGQHLVLLAGFVWLVLGAVGVPRRTAAWAVAGVVFGYAALTGLRPSALRAAVMVAAVCGAVVLRRPPHPANAFAAAWLAVMALNPTDPFDLGGRLSFVSVFVLVWGIGRAARPAPATPQQRLEELARPPWVAAVRAVVRAVAVAYGVNLVLFAVNTPLLVLDQNVASPVGLLVGPPLVVLTSAALVAGFLLFLLAPVPGIADALAFVARHSLGLGDRLVRWADQLPGGTVYTPAPPTAWVVGFYVLVVAAVLLGSEYRTRLLFGLAGWMAFGLLWPVGDPPGDGELRVTFLAVGHGGCTVLETADGRCFLYDTGATGGPDAVKRVVAPYLWHRGLSRVDEVFVSHADSDHFNNLPELLRRFPVGRVTLTPSFAAKPTTEVAETLNALKKHGTAVRTVSAGQRFDAGPVAFEVLHPPEAGPPGGENERSLVMAVRHAGHTLLFTGDLEKGGTGMVLKQPPVRADVMQAPHHGSRPAFPPGLAAWASPRFVAVNRAALYANVVRAGHAGDGVPVWDTHSYGAITVRSHRTGLTAEAFRTGQRVVIVRGGE